MDIFYELTEAECEAVAGGTLHDHIGQGDGGGVPISFFNHTSTTGPGGVLHNGPLVSFEVHSVQATGLDTTFGPMGFFHWAVPFT